MRKQFSERLHQEMAKNKDVFLLTGDLGYALWDRDWETHLYQYE